MDVLLLELQLVQSTEASKRDSQTSPNCAAFSEKSLSLVLRPIVESELVELRRLTEKLPRRPCDAIKRVPNEPF